LFTVEAAETDPVTLVQCRMTALTPVPSLDPVVQASLESHVIVNCPQHQSIIRRNRHAPDRVRAGIWNPAQMRVEM
jgi:hypothetical protein